MNPHRPRLLGRLLMWLARWIFALRYRVRVRGLEEIGRKGRSGIVFLPSHPALVDPIMLLAVLYARFSPRSVGDEVQLSRPVIKPAARLLGARVLPNLDRRGASGVEWMKQAIQDTIDGVKAGENLLIYPAGHLKRNRFEEIGGASAVKDLVAQAPDARVVLVRQNGLWGSRFSRAYTGGPPQVAWILRRGLLALLANGVFFMPRRRVDIEFVEPDGFPRHADRLTLNRYLEAFYNADASPNTYVPYGFWERGGPRILPDPSRASGGGDATTVTPVTRQIVFDHLRAVTAQPDIALDSRLGADLGLDSLATAELALWLGQEFGVPLGSAEHLVTVGDVLLAAGGRGVTGAGELRPVAARWFRPRRAAPAEIPPGDDVLGVVLRQAAAAPSRVAVADQTSGEKTYRELVTAVLLLKPLVAELPGRYVGLMFPASVGAVVFYLATLAAGKTPVMVNWTTGPRNLAHALDLLGVERVLTARALLTRLEALGIDLGTLRDRFLMVEDLRARLTLARKLAAAARGVTSWRSLRAVRPPEHAVILFTSGSESLPKAVPLTHANVLTNIRDVPLMIPVSQDDVLIGMLPPFHSFGIIVTIVLPLALGIRTVYHPNPTEAGVLARIVEAYRVTLLVGTPTFLGGIVRAAQSGQLASLRLAVTGAEKCPATLHETLESRWPGLRVIEGYGITECSPIVSANRFEAPLRESIGYLLPSVEGVMVSVETGERVPAGEPGMLLVRGPTIFGGYLNYEGESPFVVFDGRTWYRTGDLVRRREDGALFFEGRLKRFVKLGGEMISLPAIEAALLARYAREDDEAPPLAVDALGDQDDPEIVVFTCLELTRNELNETLRAAGFSPLYHVRRAIRVDAIPLLGTGKTDYRSLRAGAPAAASG